MNFEELTTLTDIEVDTDNLENPGAAVWLCIPATVRTLGRRQEKRDKNLDKTELSCFRMCPGLDAIFFEENSLVRAFEPGVFASSRVRRIFVPASVLVIGASCFEGCKSLDSVVFARDSRLMRIEEAAFSRCSLRFLTIPRKVELIGRNCFLFVNEIGECSPLGMVSFCMNSELIHLGRASFFNSSIRTLDIPKHVSAISQYCFAYSLLETIRFEAPSRMRRFGVGAFSNTHLTRISVPPLVEIICKSCFENCTSLQHVSFEGQHVVELGDKAFFGCSVNVLFIPSSVVTIGNNCFGCADADFGRIAFPLRSIDFENGSLLTTFGCGAFYNTILEEIVVPDGVRLIQDRAFENCTSLKRAVIRRTSSLTVFGEKSFSRTSIEVIAIPLTCEVIGISAFEECKLLRSVECLSDSNLSEIRSCAFRETRIEEFLITPKVRHIGASCFEKCSELKSVQIPEPASLVTIGDQAFYQSGLRQITIPASVQCIGSSCFGDGAPNNGPVIDIHFSPNSQLSSIPKHVFNRARIGSLRVPASVQFIDKNAFFGCEIGALEVDPENKHFSVQNGLMLNRDGNTILNCFCRDAAIVIQKDVVVIAKQSFSGTESIRTVSFEVESKAKVLEEEAFASSSIESIQFQKNLESIGKKCFAQCKKLQTVSFNSPCNLSLLESFCFWQSSLTSICIPAQTTTLGTACFESCKELSRVSFEHGSQIRVIGDRVFSSTAIVEVTIPRSVERLGRLSFGRCHCLKRIHFEDESEMMCIGESCFFDSGLIEITLPKKANSLGTSSFEKCTSLSKVSFSNDSTIQTFPEMLFYGAPITRISIPKSVTSIGRNCFGRDHKIEVEIPKDSQLKRIATHAFQFCHFPLLYIPASLQDIGTAAFDACTFGEIEVDPGNTSFICQADRLTRPNGDIIITR